MKDTKIIRKEIYDFVKSKGIELTQAENSYLSTKIQEHTDAREDNYKTLVKRYSFTQEQVGKYLKKARLLPKQFSKEIEVLERVSNWLNKDAE